MSRRKNKLAAISIYLVNNFETNTVKDATHIIIYDIENTHSSERRGFQTEKIDVIISKVLLWEALKKSGGER